MIDITSSLLHGGAPATPSQTSSSISSRFSAACAIPISAPPVTPEASTSTSQSSRASASRYKSYDSPSNPYSRNIPVSSSEFDIDLSTPVPFVPSTKGLTTGVDNETYTNSEPFIPSLQPDLRMELRTVRLRPRISSPNTIFGHYRFPESSADLADDGNDESDEDTDCDGDKTHMDARDTRRVSTGIGSFCLTWVNSLFDNDESFPNSNKSKRRQSGLNLGSERRLSAHRRETYVNLTTWVSVGMILSLILLFMTASTDFEVYRSSSADSLSPEVSAILSKLGRDAVGAGARESDEWGSTGQREVNRVLRLSVGRRSARRISRRDEGQIEDEFGSLRGIWTETE